MPQIKLLIKPTPPPASTTAFLTGAPAFLSARPVRQAFVGETPHIPSVIEVGLVTPVLPANAIAQQVFVLNLTEVAHNTGTVSPAAAGWRFLVGNGPNQAVMGSLIPGPATQPWKMTALYYGDRVWDAYVAARSLDALPPQADGQDYELRLLAIPGLNLEALWLEAQTVGSDDVLLPFPAAPNQLLRTLNGAAEYTMPAFLAAIRPLAANLLGMDAGYGA